MIERIDSPSGRLYRTPDGNFPSVTTILGHIPNPHIQQWRDSIGHEKADQITKRASATGTRFHTYCEYYLKGYPPKLDVFDKQSFLGIEKHLDKINPIALEKALWSKKLRAAGTVDCIGTYDGVPCIIDFKTTSQQKFNGTFDSYFTQCAAYSAMVFERSGLLLKDVLIIMQNTSGETEIFWEKPAKYLLEFIKMRDAFELMVASK